MGGLLIVIISCARRLRNDIMGLRRARRRLEATRQEGRGRRAVAGWQSQERPGEHARVSSFCFY